MSALARKYVKCQTNCAMLFLLCFLMNRIVSLLSFGPSDLYHVVAQDSQSESLLEWQNK